MDKKQAAPTSASKSTQDAARKRAAGSGDLMGGALSAEQIGRATVDARRLLPGDMLRLQRTIGNRALAQLLGRDAASPARAPEVVQPKLTVGPASDAYEIEADQIAEQVVRSPAPPPAPRDRDAEDAAIQRVSAIIRPSFSRLASATGRIPMISPL